MEIALGAPACTEGYAGDHSRQKSPHTAYQGMKRNQLLNENLGMGTWKKSEQRRRSCLYALGAIPRASNMIFLNTYVFRQV